MAIKHARTKTPMIDAPHLSRLTDGEPGTDLARNADLESLRYSDLALSQLVLSGARLDGVQLARVSADEADLRSARFTDVELDQVGFTVVRAARSQWRDVAVSGRLGSFEAYEAQWRSVHFVGCKLNFVNLRDAEVHDVLFTDCIVEELDLGGAVANRVGFAHTRLGSLNVQSAELRDFDLRGTTFDVIEGLTDLRGATLNPFQVTSLSAQFAEHFGLRIED